MALAQAGETAEIRIGGDELTAVLDGERGMISVCHQLAARPGGKAQPSKDIPARRAVCEQARVGTSA